MEKFKMYDEKSLEIYSDFGARTKEAFKTLIEDIKENIKKYEQTIDETSKEIQVNESSCDKCEKEIVKMENKIAKIKEAIENVENTYKKIVSAYSETSKGDTKNLYSDVIEAAKVNCDNENEKNKAEIARLNSDIDAIRNNIAEFTKIIEDLNKSLDGYKLELYKYNKSLDYFVKVTEKATQDIDEISLKKEEPRKRSDAKNSKNKKSDVENADKDSVRKEIKVEETPLIEEENAVIFEPSLIENETVLIDTADESDNSIEETVENNSDSDLRDEIIEPVLQSNIIDEVLEPTINMSVTTDDYSMNSLINPTIEEVNDNAPVSESDYFDESLKRIYDLTGYKKKEESKQIHEEKIESEPTKKDIDSNDLESLFMTDNTVDNSSYSNEEMSEWEKILNSADDFLDEFDKTTTVSAPRDNEVDELLKPYGTSFERLQNLVSENIVYKNGTSIPFVMTSADVKNAINDVDGNDLKEMKKRGPEITLLRKVKKMKEGAM